VIVHRFVVTREGWTFIGDRFSVIDDRAVVVDELRKAVDDLRPVNVAGGMIKSLGRTGLRV